MLSLIRMRAIYVLLLAASVVQASVMQASFANDAGRSLVESALDLPGTEEPSPLPVPVKQSSVKSSAVKQSTVHQSAGKQNAAALNSASTNLSDDSINESKPALRSAPPVRRALNSEMADPENAKIQTPAIHSEIPYSESKYFGAKTGKSYAVDPTYRGNPTLPVNLPTVSVGAASWAIPQKKKVASLPAAPATPTSPALVPTITKNGVEMENREAAPTSTLNLRFLTVQNFKPVDVVYAYPYPVQPPKPVKLDALPEGERQLKDMILSSGYSQRIDLSRPYPYGGFRWIRVFETAMKKSGTHYPHTMITMYPWVNKMFPYVLSEVRQMNKIEEQRYERYQKTFSDYERLGSEIESKAAAAGLYPIPVKINARGIGQATLPAGSWWLTATRRLPGLKFYWQVPVTCNSGDSVNVQLTEANALLVHGGW